MKYFLIGFVIWFALGWFPQLVKAWIVNFKVWRAKKKAKKCDLWIYE